MRRPRTPRPTHRPVLRTGILAAGLAAALASACSGTATNAGGEPDPPGARPPANAEAATPAAEGLHTPFDTILRDTVRDGRIDYAAVRDRHRAELDAYLDALAGVDPSSLGRDARLAFYANLYNATMIDAILDRYAPGYSTSADDWSVFREPIVRLRDGPVTLDHLENGIVRPQFGDPRIHVALVCGAESCPPILPRAYVARDLDVTLESNMRGFLTTGDRNRVDLDARRVHLSQIFEWYAEDFGGPEGLVDYVDGYVEADLAGFEVAFVPYSWALNDTVDGSRPGR